jgi:Big-like domain-containing protein
MRIRAVVVGVIVLAAVFGCGGAPPQIVDYSPLRGARDVPTSAPIEVTFDHDVDEASVASRLRLIPATQGGVQWLSARRLQYVHQALLPSTTYQVVIEAGYRDPAGNAYALRHHWSFRTEPAPGLAGSSPADGSTGVDPADYLVVDFTRAMDAASLRSAITLTPSIAFNVRLDATDDRRAIVAPDALLEPDTAYQLLITTSALDIDGNELDQVRTVRFTTGAVRPLHDWIAFATQGSTGASGGLWIVNESGFPRQLLNTGVVGAFSWSPEGDRLVFQGDGGEWVSFVPGQGLQPLGFSGPWAAALASGLGYVYLDGAATLTRELPDGSRYAIATGVEDAAVSPAGERIAFAQTQPDGTTRIWGYDMGLRSRYVLASELGVVRDLSWAPAGNRIAYLRFDTGQTVLRVRNLTGSATTTTVAKGDLGAPVWLRDSTHVLVAAIAQSSTGPVRKAFLLNVAAPPPALTLSLGLPADPSIDVTDPVPSPDGHQIAFISGSQVWLMNADGTRPVPLTQFDPDSFPYSCLMPAWTRA